ncbi:hypothetical protein [Galactobacter valiniphilus]|nr:hypothetical protein [Galactobacter valiniphilus]
MKPDLYDRVEFLFTCFPKTMAACVGGLFVALVLCVGLIEGA